MSQVILVFYFTVLAYLWPVIGRATVVAKKEVFYAFPFGLAAYLWGTLFIDRQNRLDALNRLNTESFAIQKDAAKLLMFPEGTRHQGDRLLPFKKGAFHIAIQSESAIQPVVVSRYWFLDSKRKSFGRGKKEHILLKSTRDAMHSSFTIAEMQNGAVLREKSLLFHILSRFNTSNQVDFLYYWQLHSFVSQQPDLWLLHFYSLHFQFYRP